MPRALAPAALIALAACAGSGSLEKGGPVAVSVSGDAVAAAYAPRRLGLVLGISEFEDPEWRALRYAKKDAEDLAVALRDPERGHFNRVSVITDPAGTTREGVLRALRQLAKEATRPDDVVVVYLSAHGTLARDRKGELRRYLVTHDARFRQIADTALEIDELKSEFDRLPSRRRLLVLATCHSGAGKSLLPPELEAELSGIKGGFYARPMEEASRATMVFSACDWGETAREDDSLSNDIYTHFLVEGLGGAADRNADGAVTATEAHDYARRRTYAFTSGRQRPSAEILEVGADPIVLSGEILHGGQPELYSYNPRLDGFTLKVDGEDRTDLPGGAAVSAGKRHVELTKGGEPVYQRDLVVRAGERVDLESVLGGEAPRRIVALSGGIAGFLDRRSRAEVMPPFPALGLSARYDDLLFPRVSLALDLAGGAGEETLHLAGLDPIPFRYTALSFGVSADYALRAGRWTFWAGPRVAGLWLTRSFDQMQRVSPQSYFTLSPGLLGGVGYALTDRIELQAQAHSMFTWVVVDGQGYFLGFAGGGAGVGYRF